MLLVSVSVSASTEQLGDLNEGTVVQLGRIERKQMQCKQECLSVSSGYRLPDKEGTAQPGSMQF